ncbi:iron ABC transporter permease [Clostridium sp. MSJ-4]|uniref:Iron ABC transporter permease n=1 Tax=Clostridium simiarum TaxID=2841506 RepID=A0ABS6F2M5_9CLOT|nr:iron ABC transporter permease [Clostridium simiarum]MBU5592645.1 iron ABC transporter permease [Clostridium simiarum]
MNEQGTYKKYIRFKLLIILLLVAATALTALFAISAGSTDLTLKEVVMTLLGHGDKQASIVIFNIRMPRVVTAIIAGIGLSTIGCVMQSLLRNPLASDSTLGIAQGAAFGASFAMVVLGSGMQNHALDGVMISNPYIVSICAFVSAMMSTMIVLGLSHFNKVPPESMVLAGVALSTLFSGATTILQYFAPDVKVAAVVFWTFGDLGRTSWNEIMIMSITVGIALIYFIFNLWNFNALQNGEETAKGLGVNVDGLRMFGMLICSLTASMIVSFVGIINFVGLIAPHLVRRFIGSDYRYLLPSSALMGALLLLLSDTAARLVVSPVILPIGAITSFLGAPLFLYLLFKGGGKR